MVFRPRTEGNRTGEAVAGDRLEPDSMAVLLTEVHAYGHSHTQALTASYQYEGTTPSHLGGILDSPIISQRHEVAFEARDPQPALPGLQSCPRLRLYAVVLPSNHLSHVPDKHQKKKQTVFVNHV